MTYRDLTDEEYLHWLAHGDPRPCDRCGEHVPYGQEHQRALIVDGVIAGRSWGCYSYNLCAGCYNTIIEALGPVIDNVDERVDCPYREAVG